MRWELSEEQQSLQESVRGWLDSAGGISTVRSWLEEGDSRTFAGRLASDGWLDIGLSEDRGGQGGGLVELALVAQELGAHAVPSGAWLALVVARTALETEAGAPDGACVGPIAVDGRGTILAINANLIPTQTSAMAISADGALHGVVPTVLGADSAQAFIVPVFDGGQRRLVVVARDVPGVDVVTRELVDRSRDIADVHFDGAVGTALDLDADTVLERAAQTAAVLLAADSVGAMQTMLDRTVEYTTQRHQFGVPVGSFQAVKHGAATMLVSLEAARSIAFFGAASVQERGEEAGHHAAIAKAQATNEGADLAETALTLHGAIGYTWEHNLHLFYKRAKLNAYLFGSTADWNEDLTRRLGLVV